MSLTKLRGGEVKHSHSFFPFRRTHPRSDTRVISCCLKPYVKALAEGPQTEARNPDDSHDRYVWLNDWGDRIHPWRTTNRDDVFGIMSRLVQRLPESLLSE